MAFTINNNLVFIDRFSKANNKYMKSYDVNEPSKYITYLDANILGNNSVFST